MLNRYLHCIIDADDDDDGVDSTVGNCTRGIYYDTASSVINRFAFYNLYIL